MLGLLLGLILILALMAMVAPVYVPDKQSKDSMLVGTAGVIFSSLMITVNFVLSVSISFE